MARDRDTVKRRYLRADAAFASLEVYSFLEAEGYGHAVRLPANAVLQRRIAHLLTRPMGLNRDGSCRDVGPQTGS